MGNRIVCEFLYRGEIVPATIRHGRGTALYRTPKYKAYKKKLEDLFRANYCGECRADRLFGLRIVIKQQNLRKRGRQSGDIDNLLKPVMDAGTGVVWKDDDLITQLDVDLTKEWNESTIWVSVEDIGHWHRYRVKLKCRNCGEMFEINKYQAERGNRKFCSNACRYAFGRLKPKCLNCGKEMSHFRSARLGTKFCSSACYGEHMSANPHLYPNIMKNLKKAAANNPRLTHLRKDKL